MYVVYETDFDDYLATGDGDRYFLRLVTSESQQAGVASAVLFHRPCRGRWVGHTVTVRDVRHVPPLRRIMTYAEIEALPR